MINPSDLIIKSYPFACSSGMITGKLEVGIWIKHIPTNIVVIATESESQHINKSIALKKLAETMNYSNES